MNPVNLELFIHLEIDFNIYSASTTSSVDSRQTRKGMLTFSRGWRRRRNRTRRMRKRLRRETKRRLRR
jgi:hypothetical protein